MGLRGSGHIGYGERGLISNFADTPKKLPYFIVMAGQSNPRGTIAMASLPAAYQGEHSNVKIWNGTAFENLNASGLNNNQLGNPSNMFGPEMTFAVDLANETGRIVYLMKYAIANTQLDDDAALTTWNPNEVGEYFDTLVSYTNLAKSAVGSYYSNPWFIWWQGESDATDATKSSAYLSNLQQFFTDWKSETSLSNSKIILSRIFGQPKTTGSFQYAPVVRAAELKYAYDNYASNVFFHSTDDLVTNYPTDVTHMSLQDTLDVGRQYKDIVVAGTATQPIIAMKDLCTGSSLDTVRRWYEIDASNQISLDTTNDVIQIVNPHTSTITWAGRRLESFQYQQNGEIYVASSLTWTDPSTSKGLGGFGVFKDTNNWYAWRADVSSANGMIGLANVGGVITQHFVSATAVNGHYLKLGYNIDTGVVTWYYWNGTSWVQDFTHTETLGTGNFCFFAWSIDSNSVTGGDIVRYGNIYMTIKNYSTQYPT